MKRDRSYAPKNSRNSRPRHVSPRAKAQTGKQSSWPWLMLGVLVGIGIFAMFFFKQKDWNTLTAPVKHWAQAITSTTVKNKVKNSDITDHAQAEPKFEFYTILANNQIKPSIEPETTNPTKTTTTVTANSNESPPTVNSTTNTDKATDTLNKATSNNLAANNTTNTANTKITATNTVVNYILQVASLHNKNDANHLKAELTLTGFNVHVTEIKTENTTWYRVTIGPYHSLEAAKNDVARLSENKIHAFIRKA